MQQPLPPMQPMALLQDDRDINNKNQSNRDCWTLAASQNKFLAEEFMFNLTSLYTRTLLTLRKSLTYLQQQHQRCLQLFSLMYMHPDQCERLSSII